MSNQVETDKVSDNQLIYSCLHSVLYKCSYIVMEFYLHYVE